MQFSLQEYIPNCKMETKIQTTSRHKDNTLIHAFFYICKTYVRNIYVHVQHLFYKLTLPSIPKKNIQSLFSKMDEVRPYIGRIMTDRKSDSAGSAWQWAIVNESRKSVIFHFLR